MLCEDILTDIELDRVPLEKIALKASRVARLLKDEIKKKIFLYESSGYPTSPSGVSPEVYQLAVIAGREYEFSSDGEIKKAIHLESIGELRNNYLLNSSNLSNLSDPAFHYHNTNPKTNTFCRISPISNASERQSALITAGKSEKILSQRCAYIYEYVSQCYSELKFSGLIDNIFNRKRRLTDSLIDSIFPESVPKLSSVYDNLNSENSEDWANSVHSCRRIFECLADKLYPAKEGGDSMSPKLGKQHYINRLIAYVGERIDSKSYKAIIGAELKYIGEKIHKIYTAVNKGTHATVGKSEAENYVIYTYLLISDLLAIHEKTEALLEPEKSLV